MKLHRKAILTIFPIKILLFCTCFNTYAQKQKVWVDADTGNETDDIYALVRLLKEPSIEVVGISSAHFNNADLVAFEKWNQYPTKGINTVKISQQLNQDLLKVMGKLSIPHPLGADRQMGRAWGGDEPRNSEAAKGIIMQVKKLGATEKLVVISLGALTNIASAIAIDTSIAKQVNCYVLGSSYNAINGIWNKNDFNIRNDLNAFDYLLNNPSVNLILMPVDVAYPYLFKKDSLYKALRDEVPIEKMLKQRWEETNPQDTIRTLWDLALVEAFVNPAFATIKQVFTPLENLQRKVSVYTTIYVSKMKIDFFKNLQSNNN